MTIENIRVENARALVKEAGSQVRFGERLGISRQLVNNYIGPRPVKHIGSELARKMERAFGRPVGWLDERHGQAGPSLHGAVSIEGMDAGGVLGAGRLPMLMDQTVQQMRVSSDWLRQLVGSRPAAYLAMATVTGSSLGDALPDGSVVIVDRSESAARDDGYYMLGRPDPQEPGVWFRRVVRTPDGQYRISTSNRADTSVVPSLQKAGIVVLGRVVARLEIKKV